MVDFLVAFDIGFFNITDQANKEPSQRGYDNGVAYGFDGTEYFISTDINVETSERSVLDKVIVAGKHPYWAIYYTLDAKLDLDSIQKEMHKRTGDSGWVGGYTVDEQENKIATNLEYKNSLGLLIHLNRGSTGQSLITLNYRRGGLDRGFRKAHNVFTPKTIMSLLYGEYTPIAFKKLIDQAS